MRKPRAASPDYGASGCDATDIKKIKGCYFHPDSQPGKANLRGPCRHFFVDFPEISCGLRQEYGTQGLSRLARSNLLILMQAH
jgi:hypothetical protein